MNIHWKVDLYESVLNPGEFCGATIRKVDSDLFLSIPFFEKTRTLCHTMALVEHHLHRLQEKGE
jgi:hypothetical protein